MCSKYHGYSKIKILKQQGSILIIVLWIISVSMIFVSILAKNSRLSATIVMHQQDALKQWSQMLSIINLAKMEIMISTLKKTKTKASIDFGGVAKKQKENKLFVGDKVKLSYANKEDVVVRIYDLSGKINISRLTRAKLKQILVKKIGKDNAQVSELLDAWQDWTDKDNLKRLNGAEKNYYRKQEPPYSPRNSALQSVNELNFIKGFRDIFGDYDYSRVFSLFGTVRSQLNPNIVNKETLLLIPGINETLATEIIKYRKQQLFENMTEFNLLIPAEIAGKVKGWFSFSTAKIYEIIIYSKKTEQDASRSENGLTELYAYREIVKLGRLRTKPTTLRVFPSYKISL